MSLININHFVAPFRSKLQIGAVVVLAVLVAVVRFTGMHSSSSNQDSSYLPTNRGSTREVVQRDTESGEDDIGQFLKSTSRTRQAVGGRDAPSGDEEVDSLLKGGPVAGRRPPPGAADDGTQPGKLNDIKRSLGME